MEPNQVKTVIRQEAFELSPEHQRELQLTDEVAWTFSILFGRYGALEIPLACDADGVLAVGGGALVSPNDGFDLANYFDSQDHYPPLYDSVGFQPVADLLYDILAILTDVYDSDNHWIKTLATPPA